MFHNVLDKKKLFPTIKITTFQKAKKRIVPKGLTHEFSKKNSQIFFYFFWVKIGVEIMFHYVLDKKETIYHYKNDNFSKGQTSQYSKGVNS